MTTLNTVDQIRSYRAIAESSEDSGFVYVCDLMLSDDLRPSTWEALVEGRWNNVRGYEIAVMLARHAAEYAPHELTAWVLVCAHAMARAILTRYPGARGEVASLLCRLEDAQSLREIAEIGNAANSAFQGADPESHSEYAAQRLFSGGALYLQAARVCAAQPEALGALALGAAGVASVAVASIADYVSRLAPAWRGVLLDLAHRLDEAS